MYFYAAFLLLIGFFRILELRISKKNWHHHRGSANKLKEPLFFWMVALHVSFFILLPVELWVRSPIFGGWLSWVAMIATAVAFLLRYWTLRTMGKSWNVEVVYSREYPIVSGGPYRFIRHPNYLVVCLELAFIPLIYHLYWSALVLTVYNALVLRVRIANEEAVLRQNPAWLKEMAHKPRFLPGMF